MRLIEHVLVLDVILIVVATSELHYHKETHTRYGRETYCTNDSTCPTWFTCNSQTKSCQCAKRNTDIIACYNKTSTSAVLDCNCVTYDNDTRSTFAGACFYNCENHHSKRKNDLVYYTLPKNPEMLLNKSACTYFHRTGLLCGDCEDGHSPLVLSYNLSCVKCPDGHKNWWKFILVAFVPLTFFYFFIVLFNINVTSSRLHGVVWFSQAFSIPQFVRLVMSALAQGHPSMTKAVYGVLIFYSYWNLELFRSVLPHICLNVTTLQAVVLEYTVALYPYLLILFSYIAIELYDRKVACIIILWKPFHKALTYFRKSWDVRTSIIDSFATLYLLSCIKTLSVTADILIPTQIYQLGSNKSTFGLYITPHVAYFGAEHLPYAILAIIIFTFFITIPTSILFLYPFQFFQKFLSIFPFNWHFLHAFVDSFQGCYKDETEPGTFDCRWFSAIYLLCRILLYIIYGLTLSIMYFVYATIIIVFLLIVSINVQPFKKKVVHYPTNDSIFLILFTLFYIPIIGRSVASMHDDVLYHTVLTPLLITITFVPLVYIFFLVGSWLISRRRWINSLLNRIRK